MVHRGGITMSKKEYKLWELIKMAEEYDGYDIVPLEKRPRFKSKASYNGKTITFANLFGKGTLCYITGEILNVVNLLNVFEKVDVPVDVKTACKAFGEGKTISVEYKGAIRGDKLSKTYKPTMIDGVGCFESEHSINPYLIATGVWYIEEDVNNG
jgi:hypothetical protein